MTRARTGIVCSLVSLSALLATSEAGAQLVQAEGFAIDRYNPAERGSEWFVVDSLDVRGHVRPALGHTVDYAHKPLAIYAPDGKESVALISNQLYAHFGSSLVLWDRLRVGLNVPLALVNNGQTGTAEGYLVTAPQGVAVGDVRLGADVRLIGAYGSPFTATLGVQLFAPSGKQESFTGDGKIRLLPRLLTAGTVGMFTYGTSLGVLYRANDGGFAGKETGTEITFGVSAGVRALEGKLVLGPELFGSAVIASAVEAPTPSKSPVELLLGAHYTAGPVRFGAGAGAGLTRGLGAPTARVLASVEWVPAAAEPEVAKPSTCRDDRDNDSVLDIEDACGVVPGVRDADPKKNGCPSDRDGDRLIDREDACPDVAGVASQDTKLNGCPVDQDTSVTVSFDRDGDTVEDDLDKCVDVPGLKEAPASIPAAKKGEWEKKLLGCPEDPDKDKILNLDDACPFDAGKPNKDPKKHGCPVAIIEGCQIKLLQRVYFKTQSDALETFGPKGQETQDVLNAVLQILKSHPEIKLIEVQGHASQDTYTKNQELSEGRAASVVTWLMGRGIDPTRLRPKGYGTSKPAESIPAGPRYKDMHQRVEFHMLGCEEEKAK